jgi:hypothetical protein
MARFDFVEAVDGLTLQSPDTGSFEDVTTRFSPLAPSDYSRWARAINRLRDLGLDRLELPGIEGEPFDISLPKIVLVGNQSSGKSSLIEAISQVKVPRDDNTCTRCPIEVRLYGQGGAEWNCKVSLRRRSADNNTFEITEFATTSNRDVVESLLRRAQRAILNPNINSDVFRSETAGAQPSNDQLLFSEDTIIVEIVGMDLDITFIDLPGLISSVPPHWS